MLVGDLFRLFRLVREQRRAIYEQAERIKWITEAQAELIERYEQLIDEHHSYQDDMEHQIVFLQATIVDDQRAIRNIAVDAIEALEEGEDLIPALHKLIEFTNASIANLEEHLDVTSVNDL